jgi:4-hydroxyphenylpyruvate dioxygenase-like putative hemolysin
VTHFGGPSPIRFGLDPELLAQLAQFNMLHDSDGEYFQLIARAFAKRFFSEIVERRGCNTANAPIPLAAWQRGPGRYRDDPEITA